MVATNITGARQLLADEEPTHQEEIGCSDHHLQPSGQAAVSPVEAELIESSLLFFLSLFGEGTLDGRTALIWSILWRQRTRREQPIMERLRQIVFELLDDGFLTDQHHEVTGSLLIETVGELRRRLEVPFDVREPMARVFARPEGIVLRRKLLCDRLELLFETELVNREGRPVHGDVHDQHSMLFLHDGLEGFDIRVGIDGERVRHPYRERHDPIELAIALENHEGAGAFGFVSLEKVLHIAQVVGNAEPRRVRKGFDVRLAGLERLVSEAAEDAEEYRTVASNDAVGREVQIEGDHRSLIVLAGDAP